MIMIVKTPGSQREIEKFIIREPPMGEKDDYDSENSWISDGLPSSRVQTVMQYHTSAWFRICRLIYWYLVISVIVD